MKQICHCEVFSSWTHATSTPHHITGRGLPGALTMRSFVSVIMAAVSPENSPSVIPVSSFDLLMYPLNICSLFLSPWQLSGEAKCVSVSVFSQHWLRRVLLLLILHKRELFGPHLPASMSPPTGRERNSSCEFNKSASCRQWVVQLQVFSVFWVRRWWLRIYLPRNQTRC